MLNTVVRLDDISLMFIQLAQSVVALVVTTLTVLSLLLLANINVEMRQT